MPATPPPTIRVSGLTAVVSGTAASGYGTPMTAQATTDLAREVATPRAAPCSLNDASRTSSGSPPASAKAAVNAGLKKPGVSPAITTRSMAAARNSASSSAKDSEGNRPRSRTSSTVGRFDA